MSSELTVATYYGTSVVVLSSVRDLACVMCNFRSETFKVLACGLVFHEDVIIPTMTCLDLPRRLHFDINLF